MVSISCGISRFPKVLYCTVLYACHDWLVMAGIHGETKQLMRGHIVLNLEPTQRNTLHYTSNK